jgi:hypothetical protein
LLAVELARLMGWSPADVSDAYSRLKAGSAAAMT